VVHEPRSELLPTIEHTDSDQDRLPDLPVFKPHANPEFSWGALDSSSFSTVLDNAYDETVHRASHKLHGPEYTEVQKLQVLSMGLKFSVSVKTHGIRHV